MGGISFAPVPGAKRGYYVDSEGGVYGPRGQMKPTPRCGKVRRRQRGHGYLAFTYRAPDNRQRTKNVHRAVFEAFHGPVLAGLHVRHLNGDETDNRLSDLAAGTPTENVADSYRNGARHNGERHPRARLTDAQVLSIRTEYAEGETSYQRLADKYGVTKQQIYAIVKRKQRRDV